jgi:hypothetical protein
MVNKNTDTEEIDKKKQTNKSTFNTKTQSLKNIGSFLISLLVTILYIIIYFTFSSTVLYECKLAQSNIVPTNLDCYPYTHNNPDIQKIVTDIFITTTKPQESVKLQFPYDLFKNSNNMILDMFRNYKENTDANFFIMYLIELFEGLFYYSNNAITYFFNFLNGLPEILIVLFSPILTFFYFLLVPIIGSLYFIYIYFIKMSWFFKTNTTDPKSNNKPMWKDVGLWEQPMSYIFALIFVCIFFWIFVFLLLFMFAIPLLIAGVFFICLFMTFGYKGEIIEGNDKKKVSITTIIYETFKYYKVTISVIFAIMLVSKSFNMLGALAGVFALFVILLIYFKFIKINIFESIKDATYSKSLLANSGQATKTCSKPGAKGGFMENLPYLINGGGIGKELKKLHKKLVHVM